MKPGAIAVIGMAGRFPAARSVSEFWKNLRDGVESIRDCSDAELLAAGVASEDLANPAYVKRASVLDDVAMFDAAFFGLSPRDASIMDPQHRHFLECAWEALEDAAHPPHDFDGSIGVFAGSGMNTYLVHNLLANRPLLESAGLFQLKQTGNDKDVLATRVSYQFDLRGPSITVQTACSTSLVAVHLASQSLLNFECDMALAGAVTIEVPHGLGYLYREGEILSRDGHCRSFDASSSGTVFGNGLGIVVLRRLEDAIASGDRIRAVILGSAVNNDGARKVGFLAPSVEGQVEVIQEALEFAGVRADAISYVEAHGTGTVVGDPIELRALTQAFRQSTTRTGYCGVGSVKSNVGHLDAAAGVAGLIKTILALEHAQLPPSLHFERLNPRIELDGSPFYVHNRLTDWSSNGAPRRAGVTSLGIGGTNAHVVLEEAPPAQRTPQEKPCELLVVSAKTEAAADQAFSNLLAHLEVHPELRLGDAAFTCQAGRQPFLHRRALVVENSPQAVAALVNTSTRPSARGVALLSQPRIVFMFSGQGSQYVFMGRDLYDHEPVFRETLELCARLLKPHLGIDLISALYPPEAEKDAAAERLNQTWLTQPALFSIEYALARWWMSLGIEPAAMVGHSIGEFVAACLAGVFSLEDALTIVSIRGRLIYDLPAGAMLAVPVPAEKLTLPSSLSVAAVNSPGLCVVSGPSSEIAALEAKLAGESIACRHLHTSHAFHSAMMEPILGVFEERLRSFAFHPPRRPYLSNVSGAWIKPEEATDPAYWARHIRQTVRFSDCLAELFRSENQVFVEAGPGNALTTLARSQGGPASRAYPTLPHPRETVSGLRCALQTLGHLWVAGAEPDWTKLHADGSVGKVSLPTYPFEHKRFWIDPDAVRPVPAQVLHSEQSAQNDADAFFYRRVWKPAPLEQATQPEPGCWIVFRDPLGLGDRIAARLKAENRRVFTVDAGTRFRQGGGGNYVVRPGVREDYDALIADLVRNGFTSASILHLWSVVPNNHAFQLEQILERSFYSPVYLAQALAQKDIGNARLLLVSNHMQQVDDEPVRDPARAVLLGPAGVISKELPGMDCRAIDIDLDAHEVEASAGALIVEAEAEEENTATAYRGGRRFAETVERVKVGNSAGIHGLEQDGVYLITGGIGGIGLALAEHLGRAFHARLILLSRSAVPPAQDWEASLKDEGLAERDRQRFQKLIEIRSCAADLLVVKADVTIPDELDHAIALAHKRFGKIDGVFHAAGVLNDGPLLLKTPQAATHVLDPKVRGTLALEHALRHEKLRCFVLFSSISSVLAPAGQVDYVAANAFLDAFALSRKGTVISINWDAWKEVGLAVRARSTHPLLDESLFEDSRCKVYGGRMSIAKDWVLSEHRLKAGVAILPGTGYLEMATAAFQGSAFNSPVELNDVLFQAPFAVESSESKEVRVELRREERDDVRTNSFAFSVFALDGQWTEHASGRIMPCPSGSSPKVDLAAIESRCHKRAVFFDAQSRTRQEHYFDFGPRWQSLKWVRVGNEEALAKTELDSGYARDTAAFRMHPALLDLATGCSLYLNDGYGTFDDLYLPFSYKRLRVFRPLPSLLFSHIRPGQANRPGGELQTFDLTLVDVQGDVIAEIEGFAMRRIHGAAEAGAQATHARAATEPDSRQPLPIFQKPRIAPQQGTRILTKILDSALPSPLIVAARPLEAAAKRVVRPIRATTGKEESDQDIEATLASWFQEMLGIEAVGLDDDFFAMGGHSLIGVRLFAKIQNKYKANLELAALFEARTVRLLAERIRATMGPRVTAQRKWSFLVPIQPNGSKPPLFLIHAVGGEVLFYEPLARALGPDQPVYGVQSLLVNRERIPETSIEEMASVYLEEVRALHPRGPYLLGGLSYGGLVAFEMAHQLRRQGAKVALVAMIDSMVPGSQHHVDTLVQASNLFHNLRGGGASYLGLKAVAKGEYLKRKLVSWLHLIAGSGYLAMRRPLPPGLRYSLMEHTHMRVLGRYNFRPYEGRIQLMRATERGSLGVVSLSEQDDPMLGWEKLAQGGVEIYDVAADHMNILLEPQVAEVAAKFNEMIARLDKKVAEPMSVV